MSSEKFLMFAIALSAVMSLAEANPRIVNLRDVLNRTVCPFKVEIDEDPDRVPRRIKMIRCEETPNHWCRSQNIPDNECCHHKHFDRVMECVEVRDTALVYYNSSKRTETYDVTVGCTCMIAASGAAFPS